MNKNGSILDILIIGTTTNVKNKTKLTLIMVT